MRGELRLPAGNHHPPLSLAQCLAAYTARTEGKRAYYAIAEGHKPERLFVSNTKPFQPVTTVTLARWLTSVMDRAGIDISLYKAHSTRSSSASVQVRKGLSLSAGQENTFDRSTGGQSKLGQSGVQVGL